MQAALDLAAAGFRVFPLIPNGKIPAIDGNWRQVATCDPAKIVRLWTDPVFESEIDFNVGIALDKHTLVVDIDTRDGKQGAKSLRTVEAINGELPATYSVVTASGGEHRYYAVDDSSRYPKELATHIDLKGEGGYVVGPGSTIDGRPYAASGEAGSGDKAVAPPWLCDLGDGRRPPARDRVAAGPTADLDTDAAVARAVDWLERSAPEAVEGAGGNQATYGVAAKIKDFGLSEDKAAEVMLDHWNDTKAAPPWDADELIRIVQNAYKYGTSPPGIANPESEFDSVEILDLAKKPPTGLPVKNVAKFAWSPSQKYLIRGLINFGMTGLMSGPSNAGKSPLALDLAAHVASGRPWRERKVKAGYALYVSTEGWTGLEGRLEAIRREHFADATDVPFDFVALSIDLRTSGKDAKAIADTVKARAATFGAPPALVIIDTLSHALGGGDESNPEHVRAVLKNGSRIAAATGAAVLLLHHPTKDASSDYRGSSILVNDTDLLIKVETDSRTKIRTVTTPRVKEYAEIDPVHFKIKVVDLGVDHEGDPITSVVVDWMAASELEFAAPLTPPQQEALTALEAVLTEKEKAKKPTIATFSEWKDALKAARTERGVKSGENQALVRAADVLVKAGLVAKTQAEQYVRTSVK